MCAPYKCSFNCHGRAATNHAIFKIWNARSPQMHLILLSHFFMQLIWRILRLFWQWGVLKPSFSSQKQKATRQESKQQRFMLCEFNTRKVQTAHSHSKMYRPSPCCMVACEIRCGSSTAGSWVAAKDGLHIFKRRTNGFEQQRSMRWRCASLNSLDTDRGGLTVTVVGWFRSRWLRTQWAVTTTRLGLHIRVAQSELNAACTNRWELGVRPKNKLGIFLGTKGKKT